ncbi:MAG TPA: hypothetical protein VFC67_00395 [Prolixibacteraceae bacterium]|nr:hypothetical protein [Prolixibacteraceae bacterium]
MACQVPIQDPRAWAKQMTEFQFLENLEFYQRRFEKHHHKFIRDLNFYIRMNRVHDRVFFNTVLNYSLNITLTASWIKLLKDFNSDKYTHILRFSTEFNNLNGVPGAKINPTGSGKIE